MATGGSPNCVLHLTAIAAELGIAVTPEDFDRISDETPLLCDIAPSGSGRHYLREFDRAGGVPAVMRQLAPLMNTDCLTVGGGTLGEQIGRAGPPDGVVVRPLGEPLADTGGLFFLRGTLAPGGGLIKAAAVPPSMRRHRGPARVYETEEKAIEALRDERLVAGDVVVIRYCGPKGDPGTRLMQRFLWQLASRGLHERIALVTDGRISGTNKGCAVSHIVPEAAEGGPLAAVEEGDTIVIDLDARTIDLDLPADEICRRVEHRIVPERHTPGFLSIYSKACRPMDLGAGLDYGVPLTRRLGDV